MTSEAPEQDTRDMVTVFREALVGANRVVVETRNAVGGYDATYLHAPAIADALAAAQAELELRDRRIRNEALEEAIVVVNGCDRVSEVQPAIKNLIEKDKTDD